ncbi:cyclic nucleotide-binding domain-containing protein [Roseococcus sp. SDR]|uniref:cyclic nucleotide-binding domain-containing protein n=1 Tax=Roseococcus sp. SDR TaxID=2835532 RepID=UPI001BCBB7B0|nr:cyclic nucleotide-binding domain-containing protein [Roseococcus sp. SDR]MBV1848004.1 cyclic nucleotide-binding domain-containing protein [Roseococcus sp. SDR]
MRSQDKEEMRRIGFFRGVDDPEQVDAMLRGAFLQRFPAHVELIQTGEPADFLHVIVDGTVEMFSGHRDRETTLGVSGPGDSFILAAVLFDRPYLQSARALTAARILMVPAEAVRQAFAADAGFARSVAESLALAYRGLIMELKNQKLRSGLERLANWLLAHDAANGSKGRFDLPFDKKVLAARLGMAPEVLSRSFAALVPYEVVVQGPSVVIRDPAVLRKLAQPCTTIDGATL